MSTTVAEDGSLTIIRGDTVRIPLQYVADNGTTPIDLTGVEVKAQMRQKPGGYIVLEFDIVDADLANGSFTIFASHEDTQGIRLTEAFWDLQFTYPGDIVDTVIEPSPVTIIRDITL